MRTNTPNPRWPLLSLLIIMAFFSACGGEGADDNATGDRVEYPLATMSDETLFRKYTASDIRIELSSLDCAHTFMLIENAGQFAAFLTSGNGPVDAVFTVSNAPPGDYRITQTGGACTWSSGNDGVMRTADGLSVCFEPTRTILCNNGAPSPSCECRNGCY